MIYPKIYLYKRIVQAKIFIDNNFQKDIDVNEIAEEANFSKFHFIRLFNKAYGYTPKQYLITKRIDFAKNLLRKNKSVTEVCYECGFSSIGSFSSLFKVRIGQSPSEFKINYQNKILATNLTPQKFIPGCFIKNSNFQERKNNTLVEI